jgi:GxxExxY protein
VDRSISEFDPRAQQRARFFHHPVHVPPPLINSIQALSIELPKLCSAIVRCIGSTHSESTYQNCLGIELQEVGIEVEHEVEIPLVYRNRHVVTTRRADMVLTLPHAGGIRAVLEIKRGFNFDQISRIDQLHQYMHLLDINLGYLICFPFSHERWEYGCIRNENISQVLYSIDVHDVANRVNMLESNFVFKYVDDDETKLCQIIMVSFDQNIVLRRNGNK